MKKILLSLLCAAMTVNMSAFPGALSGKFSTNSAGTNAIQFSKGNLQYQASTDTWRFAENQYDIIGEYNENISSSYEGWIDLFGWGTSGYDNKFPYMTSGDPDDYGYGDRKSITGTEYDWGVHNAISNGGNKKGVWRTFDEEWEGILQKRPNATKLFGFGKVNGICGMILLPDDWTDPTGLPAFKPALENGLEWDNTYLYYENSSKNNFSHNTYTEQEWNDIMQANGAVFLPVSGYRLGSTYDESDKLGRYWRTQVAGVWSDPKDALFLAFGDGALNFTAYFSGSSINLNNFHYGYSVRLIKDYESSVKYVVTISQPEHGTISVKETGVDLNAVAEGTKLHFVATPDEGYELDAWSGCAADGSLTVNAAATVTCTFKKKTFKVTFVDWNDAVLKAAQTVEWGAAAVPPADPTRENYVFTGWDTDFSSVKSNLTVKAQYAEGVFYTVTFLDWDATELLKEQVEAGKDAKGPDKNPTREGYTFTGWSKPITNITADLTVIAQYEKEEQGMDDVQSDKVQCTKVIRDGQLYLMYKGTMYNVQGVKVR